MNNLIQLLESDQEKKILYGIPEPEPKQDEKKNQKGVISKI